MIAYFTRRILLAIPTLLLVSLVFFALQQSVRGDLLLETGEGTESMSRYNRETRLLQQARYAGVDKPVFYAALAVAAQSDTLYRIFPKNTRHRLGCLTAQTGNWPAVERYEKYLQEAIASLHDSLPEVKKIRSVLLDSLLLAEKMSEVVPCQAALQRINTHTPQFEADTAAKYTQLLLDSLNNAIEILKKQQYPYKTWLPAVHWYGTHNQYHRWLTGFMTGDLGYSLNTQKPVGETIFLSLCTTLFINGIAFLLAFLIAIPLGVMLSSRANSHVDTVVKAGVLALHSVPAFWLGSVLMLFFTTPGFGIKILPGAGIAQWNSEIQSFWGWIANNPGKFVLPIITLTLHILAVLTLQMRGAMLDALKQDYIRTARAKGLTEQQVFWQHAFRNALFPIIFVLAGAVPAIISGSLVIDFLFAMPGMGSKTQEAFRNGDIPLLAAILMTIAILTVLSQLLADILYAWVDPRVRYRRST